MVDTPDTETSPTFGLEQINFQAESFTLQNFIQSVQKYPEAWHKHIVALDRAADDLLAIKNNLLQEGNRVTESLKKAETRADNLQAQNSALQEQINSLQGELIAKLKEKPSPASFTTAGTNLLHTRSVKHPDPPIYSGVRDELDKFLIQLRTKLLINHDYWPTNTDRLRYCLSRVEDKALDVVLPHFKPDDSITLANPKEFMDLLTQAFGDPDKQHTAQRELDRLQMKKDPFANYIASFRKWSPDTGYDVVALKAKLQQGLSQELKQLMIQHDVPEDFDDLASLLQKLDNRQRAYLAAARPYGFNNFQTATVGQRRNNHASSQYNYALSTPSAFSTSGTTPTSSVTSLTPSDSVSNLGLMPMDLDGVKKGPLSEEEKLRRKRLGLCGYCGVVVTIKGVRRL